MSPLTQPAAFLNALGHALSAVMLYDEDHPERERALAEGSEELAALLASDPEPTFTFLSGQTVYRDRVLRGLRRAEWIEKLAQAGVERLEIEHGATPRELAALLEELRVRVTQPDLAVSVAEFAGHPHIRFGTVAVGGLEGEEALPVASLSLDLRDEYEAVERIERAVATHDEVPVGEALGVVRLLSAAMHGGRELLLPLLELKNVDQYSTIHSINVSVLAMALAEFLEFAPSDARSIGAAALLHDVGKTRIPLEVLNKPGELTPDEWTLMKLHTVEGARILLKSGPKLDLAAIVAYEHHLKRDGTGYPGLHYRREPHPVSRLIQVCDVYDALHTTRPFRPAWSVPRALAFLGERAEDEMDPEFVEGFLTMIRQWEPQTARIQDEGAEPAAAGRE